jgi:hypothetical protein
MEPEGSRDPATGPCPEPDESSSHYATVLKIHFNIILTRSTGFQAISYIQVLWLKFCIYISHVLRAPPISSFFILSP